MYIIKNIYLCSVKIFDKVITFFKTTNMEKILKEAENNYIENVVKFHKVDENIYLCSTSCRNQYGSLYRNNNIILVDELPTSIIFDEIIDITSENNWMVQYICDVYNCTREEMKEVLKYIIAMPD